MSREEFEELKYTSERLDLVFFVEVENAYLPHDWGDQDAVNDVNFLNGAWYVWQEKQKQIDELKSKLKEALECFNDGNFNYCRDILEEIIK